MVKRTVEAFLCDICGAEGARYTVAYPDGTLVMDRCSKHDSKLQKMRDETGQWNPINAGKDTFRLSTPEEIRAQLKN